MIDDNTPTQYSLKAVLAHSPTQVAAAIAAVLNIAGLVAAVTTHADLGPLIAGVNAGLLPILTVLVVSGRVVAIAPLHEFKAAVDASSAQRPLKARRK